MCVNARSEMRTLANIERTYTLRAVQLVRGNGKQMYAELRNVDRNLTRRLDGVRMQRDVRFGRDFADLRDWLNRAQLIIRKHYCNKYSLGPNRSANVFRIHEAFAVDGQKGDRNALFFQRSAGVEDRAMFNGRSDDMLAASGSCADNTENRVVVGFGASAGKHNFRRMCAQ